MKIRYSQRALEQLASLHEYLSDRNSSAAENVTASIARSIVRLQEFPLLGKLTDEADVHVVIEPEYLYRIFYRTERDRVYVIRILHHRQIRSQF